MYWVAIGAAEQTPALTEGVSRGRYEPTPSVACLMAEAGGDEYEVMVLAESRGCMCNM